MEVGVEKERKGSNGFNMAKERERAEDSSQRLTQLHILQGSSNKIVPLLAFILFITSGLENVNLFLFYVFGCMHVSTPCLSGARGAQKKESFHLELEVRVVVSLWVVTGNQTWIL